MGLRKPSCCPREGFHSRAWWEERSSKHTRPPSPHCSAELPAARPLPALGAFAEASPDSFPHRDPGIPPWGWGGHWATAWRGCRVREGARPSGQPSPQLLLGAQLEGGTGAAGLALQQRGPQGHRSDRSPALRSWGFRPQGEVARELLTTGLLPSSPRPSAPCPAPQPPAVGTGDSRPPH